MEIVNVGYRDYDGSQLHHAFAYEQNNVLGPTISFFVGKASVKEHLVDLEDSLANDFIHSDRMVHFIIEIPNATIREAVVWQRFFIYQIARQLETNTFNMDIDIEGDDLMIEGQKLSVSIATLSRFSGLIHVGINVHVGDKCPVSAIGLETMGALDDCIDELEWASKVARIFADEYIDIVNASYKVIER